MPGITEADLLLPETGTLVLRSSSEKSRAVSLVPRVHLAIVRPEILRVDMRQVFAEAKDSTYLVFITGPSRTADIELTVTLGVHGPKNLYVWVVCQQIVKTVVDNYFSPLFLREKSADFNKLRGVVRLPRLNLDQIH